MNTLSERFPTECHTLQSGAVTECCGWYRGSLTDYHGPVVTYSWMIARASTVSISTTSTSAAVPPVGLSSMVLSASWSTCVSLRLSGVVDDER